MDMLILHHVLQVADHPRSRQVIAVEDERLVHVQADRKRPPVRARGRLQSAERRPAPCFA
jgi:hypothetical protein